MKSMRKSERRRVIPSYTLRAYWGELDDQLKLEKVREAKRLHARKHVDDKAMDAKAADAKIDEDERSYNAQVSLLNDMYTLGMEVEDMKGDLLGYARAAIGEKLDRIALLKFGKDEIPEIKGPRSLHFAEKIYLEHTRRLQEVYFNPFIKKIALLKGIKIDKRVDDAHQTGGVLEDRIDEYKRLQRVAALAAKDEQAKLQSNEKSNDDVDQKRDQQADQQINLELKALEEKRAELDDKVRTLSYFRDDFLPLMTKLPEKRNAKDLKTILYAKPMDEKASLEEMMDVHGFSPRTKSILLGHESNKNSTWNYYYYYRPYQTLKECLEEEIKGLSQVEKAITAIDKQSEKLKKQSQKLCKQMLKRHESAEKERARSSTLQAMSQMIAKLQNEVDDVKKKENGEVEEYRKALQGYIKSVLHGHKEDKQFKASNKHAKLKAVQDELLKEDDCKYKELKSLKDEIIAVRTEVSQHRDRGCLWNVINRYRKTASQQRLEEYFDEENTIKKMLVR